MTTQKPNFQKLQEAKGLAAQLQVMKEANNSSRKSLVENPEEFIKMFSADSQDPNIVLSGGQKRQSRKISVRD